MNPKPTETKESLRLREQAEKMIGEDVKPEIVDIHSMTPEAIAALVHNLQVHQIELQLQNEELHSIQADLEESQTKYYDLYNKAPVGYIAITESGGIAETNDTFCDLLGYPRQQVLMRLITDFIVPSDQDIYCLHKKHLKTTGDLQTCVLRLMQGSGTPFWARMSAVAESDPIDKSVVCLVTVTDISVSKNQEILISEQSNLLQALFDSPEVAIFSLDRDYCYTAFIAKHQSEMGIVWNAEIQAEASIFDFITIPVPTIPA